MQDRERNAIIEAYLSELISAADIGGGLYVCLHHGGAIVDVVGKADGRDFAVTETFDNLAKSLGLLFESGVILADGTLNLGKVIGIDIPEIDFPEPEDEAESD